MTSGSFRLDICEFDHFRPLLGFVGNELSEVVRRAGQRRAAQVGETGLSLGITDGDIYFPVQLFDNLCACASPSPKDTLAS